MQQLSPGEYVEWLRKQVHDSTLPSTTRARVASASFALAQEHHHSITLLVEHRLFGSAFSLLRSAYEAYVRGEWIWNCATDEQLRQMTEGRGAPKLDRMLKSLEQSPGHEEGVLAAVKREHWKTMSEYTHSGALHLQRWQSEDAVEPNYSTDEIKEVVGLAEVFGSVSAISILLMAENAESAERIYKTFKARSYDDQVQS